MPTWVNDGYQEYAKRLPPECQIKLIEIPAEKRGKNADLARIKELEGKKILNAIPKNTLVVAMAIKGKNWNTEQLAEQLEQWQSHGQSITLLIGGPEGLADACYERADLCWSLSPLTLPHPLVRVVLAEQLYRAWSLIKGHPYHR